MLFDEADALFGKRSDVKDVRDRTPTTPHPVSNSKMLPIRQHLLPILPHRHFHISVFNPSAIAAQESAITLLTDDVIVCVSNYRSYELSEDRAITPIERECDRLESGVRSASESSTRESDRQMNLI